MGSANVHMTDMEMFLLIEMIDYYTKFRVSDSNTVFHAQKIKTKLHNTLNRIS